MIATLAAAATGAIVAVLVVFALVRLTARYRATQNVLGTTPTRTPANPANQAARTPAGPDRTQHTPTPANAPPSHGSAGKQAIMRRVIDAETGELRVSLLPAEIDQIDPPAVPPEPREWPEIAMDALRSLATMRHSASQYKSLAETLEASLYAARQEAEQQRDRADRLQALYVERTRQALHAGVTIVIDHAGRHHDH